MLLSCSRKKLDIGLELQKIEEGTKRDASMKELLVKLFAYFSVHIAFLTEPVVASHRLGL